LYNLLKDLEEKYPTECTKAGLTAWVNKLREVNQEFISTDKERLDETTAKTNLVLKQVRVQMDAVYRDIVERIHAAMIMEGEISPYTDFVDDLNTLIKKISDIIAQQQGVRAATKEKAATAAEPAAQSQGETTPKIDPEIEAFVKEAETPKK
jgi:dsRNA-specific ribonuclease